MNKCNNSNNKKRFYSVIRQKNRIGTASIRWLALPDEPILSHKTNTRSVHIRDSEDQQTRQRTDNQNCFNVRHDNMLLMHNVFVTAPSPRQR